MSWRILGIVGLSSFWLRYERLLLGAYYSSYLTWSSFYWRGKFIGKLNAFSQEFHYVRPEIYVRILNLFTTSFYGSSLWNHNSKDCDKFFTSWNVAIRHCFGVSRKTHRYLIEEISQSYHPQVMMSSRLVSFHSSLISSNKFPVRFLARLKENDQRSVLGQNLAIIRKICGGKILSKNLVKKTMKYFPIPEEEKWRLSIIRELLDCKDGSKEMLNFTRTEIEDMLDHICTEIYMRSNIDMPDILPSSVPVQSSSVKFELRLAL